MTYRVKSSFNHKQARASRGKKKTKKTDLYQPLSRKRITSRPRLQPRRATASEKTEGAELLVAPLTVPLDSNPDHITRVVLVLGRVL